MPELPEVEITRRGIEPLIVNKTIEKIVIHNPSLRWPVPLELADILPHQQILSINRRSKYLLVACSRGTLIIHLGMTGHLRCVSGVSTNARRKHDHLEMVFTDGTTLLYNDSRRFGAVLWTDKDPLQHPLLSGLGPEPLSNGFNADYLYQVSRGRKVAIKQFIMNSHVVVGVGNIYASEALFRAGISPRKAAGKVSRQSMQKLVLSIVDVLNESISAGGTTIRDFFDAEGNPGYFKQELRVYGRHGLSCVVCGETIKQLRLGQRSTYYCPGCQK